MKNTKLYYNIGLFKLSCSIFIILEFMNIEYANQQLMNFVDLYKKKLDELFICLCFVEP